MTDLAQIVPCITRKIEAFFSADEKSKQACLNLATYLFASPARIREMSMADVVGAMEAEDGKTVRACMDFCSGPLGLIETYAVVSLDGQEFDLTVEELNQAVQSGRVSHPKTGVRQMYSYLRHPLYKLSPALDSSA